MRVNVCLLAPVRGLEYSGALSGANCGLKDQVGRDYCRMSLVSTQSK